MRIRLSKISFYDFEEEVASKKDPFGGCPTRPDKEIKQEYAPPVKPERELLFCVPSNSMYEERAKVFLPSIL
jgi:hypothetical protein